MYLLILTPSEGIAVRARHLPRIGDTIDVQKDYGARTRIRFLVESVQHEITVEDLPNQDIGGCRGRADTFPQVLGKIVSRKVGGVWEPVS